MLPDRQRVGIWACTFLPFIWRRLSRGCDVRNVVFEVDAISGNNIRQASHLFKKADLVKGVRLGRRGVMGNKTIHKVLIMRSSQGNGLVRAVNEYAS